jgi:hypothetical protein
MSSLNREEEAHQLLSGVRVVRLLLDAVVNVVCNGYEADTGKTKSDIEIPGAVNSKGRQV